MRQFKLMHETENQPIVRTLDDAFLEALALAENGSCEAAEFDTQMLQMIQAEPNWLDAFKDDYKLDLIQAYGFEIIEELPTIN